MNDVNVYLGRQREGEERGPLIERICLSLQCLSKCWSSRYFGSKKLTTCCLGQRMCAFNLLVVDPPSPWPLQPEGGQKMVTVG